MNELNVIKEGKLRSNVLSKSALRKVQRKTLATIAEYLMNSSGPQGSNTMITKDNAFTQYTKDGHTILASIKFLDTIENSIVDESHELTGHVVNQVGDGTTSVMELSHLIFEQLIEDERENVHMPYELIEDFKYVANLVEEKILENAKIATVDDLYDIAMISTNGNKSVSNDIYNIYKSNGTGVFINVGFSNTPETIVKIYDGLTLNTGYMDGAFINGANNKVSIRNPKIYAFKDPVATPELIAFFDKIVYENILKPYTELSTGKKATIVPTVIFCPMISRDLSTTMDKIINLLFQFDQAKQTKSKPPILIITDLIQEMQYLDIMRLCNCKMITNYINPDRQRKDIDDGNAPDIETVIDWCGTADVIESTKDNTTIINPYNMFNRDENGKVIIDEYGAMQHTDFYDSQVQTLQQELDSLISENAKLNKIADARRRLNTLKANMVDYLIGGITTTDRDSVKHLAEDAVSNCRSAANNGFGYGANFEAIIALSKLTVPSDKVYIHNIMINAYRDLLVDLYRTRMSKKDAENEYLNSLSKMMPINLRTLEYDNKVLSSIKSDVVILDCIAKIITVMFTSNQAIVSNPIMNVYDYDIDEE